MRVVIAEDAAVMRELLAQMLTMRGHHVAAVVGDADALRAAVAEHRPDVAVVDIRMPPTGTDDGLRAAVDIRREHPGTGVLLFSQYIETAYATRLLAQGAQGVGYLLKERVANLAEFTGALDRVAAGGTALDPDVVTQLAAASRRTEDLHALTDRERGVLALMAEGRSNAAIAQHLYISAGTVEKHIAAIFAKLGLTASHDHNRRVLAVVRALNSDPDG
ncbi:response regulator transcription factor [Cellulomonas sp. ACRRI]|uniref:response regulator transcription factor n=1 Tax=Cellulomonas sp. ACRRI TaxID=2918188 RepID=UPI001EF3387F|nr:response regulator transcription factor [Cellulomonas sp. ACRRI]MCG7285115.1 response regulator transcription factor [Cellulomonas sp. ACRRI]